MNKKMWTIVAGTAAVCAAMAAAPGYTAGHRGQSVQTPDEPRTELRKLVISSADEGGSWLGVETRDVTAERAKELKLAAERGAMIGKVAPDSPASKAGLKENDVVTELNGQHVEGALQFRRMIRETPAGRNVQMTVWRDGRTQTLSATLAQAEGRRFGTHMKATPGTFAFRMPDMPEMPELPEVAELPELPEVLDLPDGPGTPGMQFDGNALFMGHPRLGIDVLRRAGRRRNSSALSEQRFTRRESWSQSRRRDHHPERRTRAIRRRSAPEVIHESRRKG
jgi:membrane-associated protease RseP (regulator of RpoE activity)